MYCELSLDNIHVLLPEFMPYIGTLSTEKLCKSDYALYNCGLIM